MTISPVLAILLALAAAPAARAAAQTPSAFDLVERAHRAYQETTGYSDAGEIAVETRAGEARFRFETRAGKDGASYLLERLGAESPDLLERPAVWAIWRSEAGAFLYDGESDTYRPIASLEDGITEMLGVDRRAAALVALELFAGSGDRLLGSPSAATIAGEVDCAGRRCWSVDVTPSAAPALLRLSLDTETHLVRAIEIALDPIDTLTASDDVATALRQAKTRERGNEATRIVVRYDPVAANDGAAVVSWTPPSTARLGSSESSRVADAVAGGATTTATAADTTDEISKAASPDRGAGSPDRAPGRVFSDEIDVRLSTVSVRVIDSSGRAIPDLGPADFKVTIGGDRVAIQSVDWISPSSERFTPDEIEELARSGVTVPAPGRLIVLFVQTDIHPARAPGHLRLLPELRKLLATFHAEDQVAVVSFDSHLKLRQDFTRDVEVVDDAVWRGIRTGRPDEIAPGRFPSLARHFDFEAAKRAASPEKALRVLADALLPLPGEKVMIYAGWGLGDYFAGTVTMTPEYHEARESIARARVTVFVLDVTQADYHSLEAGLQTIAEDTGGTYEKTFRQPLQMTKRLAGTLEGYYEIGFSVPAAVAGRGKVDVDLVGRNGEVLQRPTRISG